MKRTIIALALLLLASPVFAQSSWDNYVPPTPAELAAQKASRERLYAQYPDWGCHPGIDCCTDIAGARNPTYACPTQRRGAAGRM